MKHKNKLTLLFITISIFVLRASQNPFYKSQSKIVIQKKYLFDKKNNLILNDTLAPIKMGTIPLSEEFNSLLFVDKNTGINVFKFKVPFDGNIVLNGFVSAGTNGKMLYSRLIKNGKIISEKTCGIGNPLYNGSFNYQSLVNVGDKLSIQILVHEYKWQLHCCPDLYSCTYIMTRN